MCKLLCTFEINPKNNLEDEIEVSFIPMKLISEGFSNEHSSEIKKWNEVKKGFTHFQENDVAVAKITPCFENRKSVVFRDLKNNSGAGTTELHLLRPIIESSISNYVLWFLKTEYFINYGISHFSGAVGQQRVGKSIIEDTWYPLPPLSEQHRIVSEVEKWFALIEKIETSKVELESAIQQTKQKVLDLAIRGKLVPQDPHDEPASVLLKRINPKAKNTTDTSHYPFLSEGWDKCLLSDICVFERGITFPSSAKKTIKSENHIACVRTANIQETLELDDLLYVDKSFIKNNLNKILRKNDIIISSANSRELVGKTSFVETIVGEITFGGFVMVIRSNYVSNKYLFYFLRDLFYKGIFFQKSSQTTNIANINATMMGNLILPVPPLAEQQRIVKKIEEIFKMLDQIKDNLQANS